MEKENNLEKKEEFGIERKELLYSGKTKDVFLTGDPNIVIQSFRNDATAFNGQKHELVEGKGKLCNKISSLIFNYLRYNAIETHFIERLNDTEMLVKKLKIIPVEVVVRNYAAGSIVKRLGFVEGTRFIQPVVEYYYKNDELGDPLINEDHVQALKIKDFGGFFHYMFSSSRMLVIRNYACQINALLQIMFSRVDIKLVDFKLEFGVIEDENIRWPNIILGDEISPDSCRLWDMDTNKKLDKDNFRFDLGDIRKTYSDICCRLMVDPKNREFYDE